ncbi:hypothetical protein TEA_014596 [Camellia sinensis var. sinensis]|uniref:Major facilitator superfamily (MFS) profile domain-containing protein n=1 Tax=Camellia sinensis var. sinensis TaxID=542762 RepID=A0A4S4E1G0_CAMSN|nr:hypothetical protein TEA_014596 [Camellia sinensis var. sinensis]
MSSSNNGGGLQSIPTASRKMVQSLKKIVNCPELEIYAMLKESRFRGFSNSSSRGGRDGTDRYVGRAGSTQSSSFKPGVLLVKPSYKKENVKDNEEEAIGLVLKKGLHVDDELELELKQTSMGRLGKESSSHKLGFDWTWPPWKNVPLRYKIIGTTSLAFVICNMDKVNLSIAIIPMSHQFGWSSSVAGLVQTSFYWGYALSQLPGGWLAKTFGGRKVLEIGVLIWSLATSLVLVLVLAGFMPGLVLSRIMELSQFVEYGCEGSILLLQTCSDHINFCEGDVHNIQLKPDLLAVIFRYLL